MPNETSTDGRFMGPCSIAKKWAPYEISIVSVPAATFWQRGETIDRINDTAKTIPANTIQAIGKRIGVVAMEAAPGQKYSVNVVGVYSFPKKASEAITAGADVYWDNTNGVITATAESNILAGYAIAAAAAADAVVSIKINA